MDKKEKICLKRFINVLKKNTRVIILVLFLFVLFGYFYSYNIVVPKYKSTSSIVLTSDNVTQKQDSVTQGDLTLNNSLISTYGEIIKSTKVIGKVIENLNLDITEVELYKNINIKEINNTQIIQIEVINEEADRAQKIAQELDNVFIEEINQIYKVNNVTIIDKASINNEPYNINHFRDIILFFIIGIICVGVVISIIYILDTTVKIQQDIEEYVGLKVVGILPINKTGEEIIFQGDVKSVIAEAFKTIRTNLSFSKSEQQSKSFLFTSCNASEGKSWITSNMTVAYAWSNKNVIVVDADMRKGRLHNIFKVSNQSGLSECLKNIKDKNDYQTLQKYIKETDIPKVHIITSGSIPSNPSELLSSHKLDYLIYMLKKVYDIVIIDGTPCNLVSDSIPVSRIVDTTIIVTESRKTKIEDIKNTINLIQNVGGNIEGAILNKKDIKGKEYKKGYYYGEVNQLVKVEMEKHTVKELIENRKEDVEDEIIEKEEIEPDNNIYKISEKISELEEKILNLPNVNWDMYKQIVDDMKKIYDKEIDKVKLVGNIKENIVNNELVKKFENNSIEMRNILEQKIQQLNYSEKMEELDKKLDKFNEKINEKRETVGDDNKDLDYLKDQNDIFKELVKEIQENKNLEKLNKNTLEGIKNSIERQKEKMQSLDNTRILMRLQNLLENQNEKIKTLDNRELLIKLKNGLELQNEKIQALDNKNVLIRLQNILEKQNEKIEGLDNHEILIRLQETLQKQREEIQVLDNREDLAIIQSMLEKQNKEEINKLQGILERQGKEIKELDNKKLLNDLQNGLVEQNLSNKELLNILKNSLEEQSHKIEELENMINEKEIEKTLKDIMLENNKKIKAMELEHNRKMKEIKVENEKKIKNVTAENEKKLKKADNSQLIKEILKEIKKMNTKYEKLELKLKEKSNSKNKTKKIENKEINNKNNIIELEKVKEKRKKEELVVKQDEDIYYEQLLDLAIEIYDIDPETYTLKRRAD